jgi:hypothetical protein
VIEAGEERRRVAYHLHILADQLIQSRYGKNRFAQITLVALACDGVPLDAHMLRAVMAIKMGVDDFVHLAGAEYFLMRAVFAILVAWDSREVGYFVAIAPHYLFPVNPVIRTVRTVGRNNVVILIDQYKGIFLHIYQRLQFGQNRLIHTQTPDNLS